MSRRPLIRRERRHSKLWHRDDAGSLPFALLVTFTVVSISGFLLSVASWQGQNQQAVQQGQDSQWAAINALNTGVETFQTVTDPTMLASRLDIPITTSEAIPLDLAWVKTPNDATMLRWWGQIANGDTSRILLHGEGKSGSPFGEGQTAARQATAITSLVATLNFDYARNAWVLDPTVRPWQPAIGVTN